MKRFFKEVSVAPAKEGFAVLLDGRPIRTPAGKALTLPTETLASANVQDGDILRLQPEITAGHS